MRKRVRDQTLVRRAREGGAEAREERRGAGEENMI